MTEKADSKLFLISSGINARNTFHIQQWHANLLSVNLLTFGMFQATVLKFWSDENLAPIFVFFLPSLPSCWRAVGDTWCHLAWQKKTEILMGISLVCRKRVSLWGLMRGRARSRRWAESGFKVQAESAKQGALDLKKQVTSWQTGDIGRAEQVLWL